MGGATGGVDLWLAPAITGGAHSTGTVVRLTRRILTGSHRQQVLGILWISENRSVGHRKAHETLLVVSQEHIETTTETVVSGGSIVTPAIGVDARTLPVVEIEATDDSRFGESGNGIGHQQCLVGDAAGVIVDSVITGSSSRHVGSMAIGSHRAVVCDDLACGEGAMILIDPAIENADHLSFSMNAVVIDGHLVVHVGLDDPAGGAVAQRDIGCVLDEEHAFDGGERHQPFGGGDDG